LKYLYKNKKFMKKLLMVATASLFLFGKCNKDSDTAPTSFLVLTAGSNFTYTNTQAGVSTTNKLTVTSKDTSINSKTYKVLSNSGGANNYWCQSGSDYYRFGVYQGLTTTGVEELYMKEADVNATWTNVVPVTFNGTNQNVNASYKISEKEITKTVAGKVYTGVTRVTLTLSVSPFGSPFPLGGGDLFYARGIGMINYNLTVGNTNLGIATNAQNTDLIAYEIK
jgi:hypothetical protein